MPPIKSAYINQVLRRVAYQCRLCICITHLSVWAPDILLNLAPCLFPTVSIEGFVPFKFVIKSCGPRHGKTNAERTSGIVFQVFTGELFPAKRQSSSTDRHPELNGIHSCWVGLEAVVRQHPCRNFSRPLRAYGKKRQTEDTRPAHLTR